MFMGANTSVKRLYMFASINETLSYGPHLNKIISGTKKNIRQFTSIYRAILWHPLARMMIIAQWEGLSRHNCMIRRTRKQQP
jgi:hypothetical protein